MAVTQLSALDVVAAARRIIDSCELCFLATQGAAAPHLRVMQQFDTDSDLTTWLGTSRTTRKATDIVTHPRVTVGFQGADGASYVALTGTARLIDDPQVRHRYWRPEWAAFFPGAPEGGDYVVVAITAERMEVADFPNQIAPPPYGVAAAVVTRVGESWVSAPPVS